MRGKIWLAAKEEGRGRGQREGRDDDGNRESWDARDSEEPCAGVTTSSEVSLGAAVKCPSVQPATQSVKAASPKSSLIDATRMCRSLALSLVLRILNHFHCIAL